MTRAMAERDVKGRESPSSTSDDDWIEDETYDTDTSDEEEFPGVSGTHTTLNLAKCMIGEGMLSLAGGLGHDTGLGVGVVICICFALLMGYTFSLLGRVCEASGSKSLDGCCTVLKHPRVGKAITGSITVLTYLACVSFSIILGDSLSSALRAFGVQGVMGSYRFALILAIVAVEVPLCLIRDMSRLAFTSLIGVACEFLVIIFMAIRAFDGSYAIGGTYYATLPPEEQPDFGEGLWNSAFNMGPTTVALVCALATAYIAHFQSPKFYHQLRKRSVRRFNTVTATGFGLASGVFLCSMTFGYLTFGQHSRGNILNNYSTDDPLATAARLAMLIAVACGYPIVFTGLRDSILQTLSVRGVRRRSWVSWTVGILVPIVSLACFVDDLGMLNQLVGAILGAATTLVYPAVLCFLSYKRFGRKFCRGAEGVAGAALMLAFALFLMYYGTWIVLSSS